jgi:predicted transcriptional regulator
MSDRSLITYVGSSSVRADVVSALCQTRRETDELLDSLDASESAVYDALSALERRGVVASVEDGWRLTGVGRLVGDRLDRQQATEELLAEAPEYWQHHDTSVLPKRFRRRLPELGGYDVVRATPTDLDKMVRAVVERVESV